MSSLDEKVVLVTGASRGIGSATAAHLASIGAKVVVVARDAEALEARAARIRADGGEALAVRADVTSADDVERVIETTIARFGRLEANSITPVEGIDQHRSPTSISTTSTRRSRSIFAASSSV